MSVQSGLLLVDKPKGITSHDVVARLRRILKTKSVGHSGTLDPGATGLMVTLINEGTKLSDFYRDGEKGYTVQIKFGVTSDTLDMDGEVSFVAQPRFTKGDLESEISQLQGELELEVPAYSAVKVKGKRLYELARSGQEIAPPKRVMRFENVKLLDLKEDWAEVSMECSKGSFIRTWVSELGQRLGCGAVVAELRRSLSEPFRLSEALTLEDIERAMEGTSSMEPLGEAFVPMNLVLQDWKAVSVKGRDETLMQNGQVPKSLHQRLIVEQKVANQEQRSVGIRVMSCSGDHLMAIIEAIPNKGLKIRRKFN